MVFGVAVVKPLPLTVILSPALPTAGLTEFTTGPGATTS